MKAMRDGGRPEDFGERVGCECVMAGWEGCGASSRVVMYFGQFLEREKQGEVSSISDRTARGNKNEPECFGYANLEPQLLLIRAPTQLPHRPRKFIPPPRTQLHAYCCHQAALFERPLDGVAVPNLGQDEQRRRRRGEDERPWGVWWVGRGGEKD